MLKNFRGPLGVESPLSAIDKIMFKISFVYNRSVRSYVKDDDVYYNITENSSIGI